MAHSIYYDHIQAYGVNITYDFKGERNYDFFSSMCLFNAWCSSEFPNSKTIEITNSNYCRLAEEGVI